MPAAAEPKTTKTAKAPPQAAIPNPLEAFSMQMPAVEMPAAFREFAEKSVEQARDGYAKMKVAAEEATDMVEDSYETARAGALEFSAKTLDMAKVNTDATFAFTKDLFGARTFAEVIELQSSFARQQFDTFSAQAKELQEITQKYVTDASKPVQAQFEKTLKDIKVG